MIWGRAGARPSLPSYEGGAVWCIPSRPFLRFENTRVRPYGGYGVSGRGARVWGGEGSARRVSATRPYGEGRAGCAGFPQFPPLFPPVPSLPPFRTYPLSLPFPTLFFEGTGRRLREGSACALARRGLCFAGACPRFVRGLSALSEVSGRMSEPSELDVVY